LGGQQLESVYRVHESILEHIFYSRKGSFVS
jgi:hypothetical protein